MVRVSCVTLIFTWSLVFARDVTISRDPNWTGVPLLGRQAAVLAFSDELMRDVGRRENFSVTLLYGNPDSLFDYLEDGSVDAILADQQPFPALRQRFAFSEPYLSTGPVLVVEANSDVDAFWKMTGKIVGIQADSDARLVAAEVPLIVIKTFPSDAVALDRLANGEIDGVLMPAIPAYAFVANLYHGQLRIVTPPLTDAGLRLITLRDNEKLVDRFNEGLEAMVRSGRYKALQRKWQLHLDRGPTSQGVGRDPHRPPVSQLVDRSATVGE